MYVVRSAINAYDMTQHNINFLKYVLIIIEIIVSTVVSLYRTEPDKHTTRQHKVCMPILVVVCLFLVWEWNGTQRSTVCTASAWSDHHATAHF
mmetsp:Transcript_23296/g.24815  ORF Transcript_23296/g.24815 Transcript_23296/m.24815 type:complete len:93 (+) Transcript_23296:5-283(+)